MKKTLVFDMDGTLFDTMGKWYQAGESLRMDIEKIEDLEPLKISEYVMLDAVYNSVDGQNLNYDQEKIYRYLDEYLKKQYSDDNLSKAHVKEKIAELHDKGYKMYVATATDLEYAKIALESNGLAQYIDKIYTPDKLKFKKHDVRYFEKIVEDLGVDGDEIVFFDDAKYATELANSLGFTTVAVNDTYAYDIEENKKIADYYIESFAEIDDEMLA